MACQRRPFSGQRSIVPTLAALCLAGMPVAGNAAPSVFASFDELPATAIDADPGSGGDWLYTTKYANSNSAYVMTMSDWAGWRSTKGYSSAQGTLYNFYYLYFNTYNSDHMGWETYGFLEIDGSNAVSGNSLRYTVTGGKNSSGTNGLTITTKAHYTNYLYHGINPVASNVMVGHPCIYFANSSATPFIPFPEAQGANRLSMYFNAPTTLTNQGPRPRPVIHIGPYNGVGGHWYHELCTQGGGWTHAICDGHPQHNNSWHSPELYPYPSSSLRDMGTNYFTNWYKWYITFIPYSGIGRTPYSVWFDEIEFQNDPELQNNETICSPSVTYFPTSASFEIGFMDKYKNCSKSYSTYELRYSFDPINNANWSGAAPAKILTNAFFCIHARDDGKFQKYSQYYQSVWAPFTLATPEDTARLTPGTSVYFAIKDISQIGGDGMLPVTNSGIGRHGVDGRDYVTYGTNFDYAGDAPALPLIKRIDFKIARHPAGGAIGLTPAGLSFNGVYAGAKPTDQAFLLTNSGSAAFTWTNTVSYGQGAAHWFEVIPCTGALAAGESRALTAAVDPAGLNSGVHTALCLIQAPAAANSPAGLAVTFALDRADQAVSFPAIGDQAVTSVVHLAATADSGLPVVFNVAAGPGLITGGSTLSFTGSGLVAVAASQAGNSNWHAAAAVTNTIAVRASSGEGAPIVSNVRAAQRPGTKLVDIAYDVASVSPALTVALDVSTNAGATYDLRAWSVSGTGVGSNVTPGAGRIIVWDAGADLGGRHFEQMRVRVAADDGGD